MYSVRSNSKVNASVRISYLQERSWNTGRDGEQHIVKMEAINFTIQQPMALNKLNGTTHWTFLIANGIMKYVLPLIIITGLIGNTVSILVFLNRELRRLSSSIYVLAVLMSDMGLLVGLLFVWLEVRPLVYAC